MTETDRRLCYNKSTTKIRFCICFSQKYAIKERMYLVYDRFVRYNFAYKMYMQEGDRYVIH